MHNNNNNFCMKKRNNRLRIHNQLQFIDEYQTMGKKILCGKFAQRMSQTNFAVGDQDNNLLLYNISNIKPITVLNSNVSNVSSITALTFTQSDDQIIVGSNRGSINIWDLNTLKIGYCLKGHTIEVCSFYADKSNQNIVASGSFDTNAKLWDLRAKNCVSTMKNHNKRVAALCISPDSKVLITGGEDGMAFSWQIRMNRPIFQYQTNSPVLSIDISGQGLVSIGCFDRVARIYEVNPSFNIIGKTKNDTMPIVSCQFYKDQHLFTAGTDNLKVWDLSTGQIVLTDNIQTSSKGILHMSISDRIQQIAYNSGVLSYHQCFLSDVNFTGQYSYVPQINNSIYNMQSPTLRDVMSRKGPNNAETMPKRGTSLQVNNSKNNNNPSSYLTNNKSKKLIQKRTESIARQLAGIHGNINDALTNVKLAADNFNNRKSLEGQLKSLMDQQHAKFLKVMGNRAKSIQSILQLWRKGNIKMIIRNFDKIDICAASDILSQILKPSNVQISTEFGLVIAQKSKQMIKSKHITLIKNGLQYMLHIVGLFKDEMVRLKTFGCDKGVDLAREQRIRRLDQLIQQYVQVYQSHRLKRLAQKHDETSNLASKLITELVFIFQKVYGNQYDF